MLESSVSTEQTTGLSIPDKRYFTIAQVSQLTGVEPHILRQWEQAFAELLPVKRRGKRRYYIRQNIFIVQQISQLLNNQGLTIAEAKRFLLHGETSVLANAADDLAAPAAVSKLEQQVLAEIRQELSELLVLLQQPLTDNS
ncbi:MerR family transcriptional regulator [Thiopseudomonas alkaliphila]|nr:MerR family transcriptional regulator [Thiopseudomonas alkaliphila]